MNTNYLLKNELQYELPVDLINLSTESVEELYECVVNKTLELQSLITQQKSELTLLTLCFRTRLSHLRGRLLHLTELDPSASGIMTLKCQEVRDWLDSIEINLPKMDVADRPRQEKGEEDDTRNTMQEEASAQDNSSPDERQDR
jgi:hypothetical protein